MPIQVMTDLDWKLIELRRRAKSHGDQALALMCDVALIYDDSNPAITAARAYCSSVLSVWAVPDLSSQRISRSSGTTTSGPSSAEAPSDSNTSFCCNVCHFALNELGQQCPLEHLPIGYAVALV